MFVDLRGNVVVGCLVKSSATLAMVAVARPLVRRGNTGNLALLGLGVAIEGQDEREVGVARAQ